MQQEDAPQANWGDGLSVEGRVDIFPSKPLPELNAVGGAVYAARFRNDATSDLMAVVCSKGMMPRLEQINAMRMVDSSSVIRLRDSGVVSWPAQNANFYTLVYERPLLGRYWQTLDETHPTMSEDGVNHSFVAPLIKALLEFQRTGIVHGAIRPTNIFWREGSTTPPQIGEGLSAPSGVGQPVIFETIERAMCTPIARGLGVHLDDCYAFGVTLAMVVLGGNPFKGMDDQAVLRLKMEKGTFNAMIGNHRLPPSQIELLRGLLSDDVRQRWSAEDLEQWMTGRRLTPKSSDAGRRASRHIDIAGKEYWQVRPLAAALAENVDDAVKLIESGGLEKWLIRSLGDEERSKAVGESIARSREGSKSAHYPDQLVARVCIALDPSSPIRYRGIAVMPSGISSVLVDAIMNGTDVQVISEVISSQFVTEWVNAQKESKVDLVPLAQLLERVRAHIERTSFGGGLERALYELNPSLPCLSPMLKGEHVGSPRHLLAALERVARKGAHASEPMDRHIAAYLVTREKRGESLFAAMGPGNAPMKRGLALLSLYGEMQYRYGPDALPALAAWIAPLVEPAMKRFLNKPFQEKVRKQVKEAVEKGSLSVLLRRIDDPDRVVGDEQDFYAARKMYRDIQKEMAELENSMKNKEAVMREMGRPVAASLASFIALVLMSIALLRALLVSMGG